MSGNSIGHLFTVTSFGESHGPAIGCIVDGCPPGMLLSELDIQPDLDRRRPGTSRHVTQRQEPDQVQILSGVYEGRTTGTPIALFIQNQDARSKDYSAIAQSFRPGHADYSYWQKYGIRDPRGGGRSSARLTAPVVGAAAIARKWLNEQYGVHVRACLSQLGSLAIAKDDWSRVHHNPFFAATDQGIAGLEAYMDDLRKAGDSCGARVDVEAHGVPVGLGEPLFDRLDADLAHALMGINAVKGVEIGAGFRSVVQLGSEHGDALTPEGFASNHAGGVLGGISTGQPITASVAIKPTSSIRKLKPSIDLQGRATEVQTLGRHDPCVGIRAVPIVEAMVALSVPTFKPSHRESPAPAWHNQPPDLQGIFLMAAQARTLYDKLWDEHVVRTESDGTALLYIDRHLVHEVTSPQAFEGLRMAKRPLWRAESIVATADHNTPTTGWERGLDGIDDPISREQVVTLDQNIAAFKVPVYFPFLDQRQGIVHVIGPEQGATLPGMTVVCGDSHTSTHGAFACLPTARLPASPLVLELLRLSM
ncbi:MAG: hypothetical protein RL585_1589 [Pseudomonadota bacterium]